jgi:hypothetical protein
MGFVLNASLIQSGMDQPAIVCQVLIWLMMLVLLASHFQYGCKLKILVYVYQGTFWWMVHAKPASQTLDGTALLAYVLQDSFP